MENRVCNILNISEHELNTLEKIMKIREEMDECVDLLKYMQLAEKLDMFEDLLQVYHFIHTQEED